MIVNPSINVSENDMGIVWLARTGGTDGCVGVTVKLTDQETKLVKEQNIIWEHGDDIAKQFIFDPTFAGEVKFDNRKMICSLSTMRKGFVDPDSSKTIDETITLGICNDFIMTPRCRLENKNLM